jgi:hypothetical protein
MEHEPVTRELTEYEKDLAERWQVFPDAVRFWVDACGMPSSNLDETVQWASERIDLIMEAKKEFFEASLFAGKFRPELSETSS